jgi:hypothetical protein
MAELLNCNGYSSCSGFSGNAVGKLCRTVGTEAIQTSLPRLIWQYADQVQIFAQVSSLKAQAAGSVQSLPAGQL